ncbi:hypothetical protein HNY73_010894 [Argiope bruennichi]|uniref:Uncharacterized protein n=1 Tax=Argiope bruennichi TaxID=94029 RepID=A0A8T0F3C6_ARGBR|nr:hypothetical protein HNY73_010894 [Argiope bruennichi]
MDAQDSGINLNTAREQLALCQKTTDLTLQIQNLSNELSVLRKKIDMLNSLPDGQVEQEFINQEINTFQAKRQEMTRLTVEAKQKHQITYLALGLDQLIFTNQQLDGCKILTINKNSESLEGIPPF